MKKPILFKLLIFVLFLLTLFSFDFSVLAVNVERQNEMLIEKISKDFTKKFCNGIAFGLSKESAMNFANKENSLIFQNKKGFDQVDKDSLGNQIAISVIDSCGFRFNLKGEEGINKFKEDYISINNN